MKQATDMQQIFKVFRYSARKQNLLGVRMAQTRINAGFSE